MCPRFIVVKGLEEDYDYKDAYGDYDDGDDDDDECPKIDLPSALGGRCHVSDYCSKITCQASVQDKHATIIFHVNRCDKPLTATVTIKSSGFAVDWSHTFKDGDIVKLPADSGRVSSIGKVSVSLKVGLKKEGKKLHFKVSFPLFDWNLSISIPLHLCLHNISCIPPGWGFSRKCYTGKLCPTVQTLFPFTYQF